MEYKRKTITLPKSLGEDYRKYCDDNGFNLSGRIAILIREDMKDSKHNK